MSVDDSDRVRPPHHKAAATAVERIRDQVGDQVQDIFLFGSVVRDEARSDSDIDILVVFDEDAEYSTVDDRVLDIAYETGLEYECRIEIHAIRAEEFAARKARNEPFISAVVSEGESSV